MDFHSEAVSFNFIIEEALNYCRYKCPRESTAFIITADLRGSSTDKDTLINVAPLMKIIQPARQLCALARGWAAEALGY